MQLASGLPCVEVADAADVARDDVLGRFDDDIGGGERTVRVGAGDHPAQTRTLEAGDGVERILRADPPLEAEDEAARVDEAVPTSLQVLR
jgi:hypothetical protein